MSSVIVLQEGNSANYGLMLHKHMELNWFYYVSCAFIIKTGCNMVIFTDFFLKYQGVIFQS